MCGIAGLVRLTGREPVPHGILQQMSAALFHRGPDDEGFAVCDGVGLANRRLSIVGLADGHQPVTSEDQSVVVVFNGELFQYRELKKRLESSGHRFRTHTDTELVPHLWQDHQERIFDHLHGQFAFALHDRRRRLLILARDRFGICPLFWSRQQTGDSEWLLFASEIKALIASSMVRARPDLRGIDQAFHFFAVPGPSTCFAGVQALQPGHYLCVELDGDTSARVHERVYWTMTFPDRGQERDGSAASIVHAVEEALLSAVEHRLRADVPVASYLSGGIDSSLIAAMATRIRGTPPATFSVRIASPGFDESHKAWRVAKHIGARPTVVDVETTDVVRSYPELIRAAEAPVIDTASAATLMLAREVHRHHFKAALSGEGSDEWLAGYPWHKIHRLINIADITERVRFSPGIRRLICRMIGVPEQGEHAILASERTLGHHSAFHDVYGLMTAARYLFLHSNTLAHLEGHNPYLELKPDLDRMRRWHSLNQSAYWAARIHLPGHLLSLKGDRPGMNASVETRYPFLDEAVFSLLADLHPRWKMRGLRDKYILRLVGERYLPREIAWGRKVMFRAPMDSFFRCSDPAAAGFVEQLLSEDALRQTGWFAVEAVRLWQARIRDRRVGRLQRTTVELGMTGVFASQLWYHTFIEPLAELPAIQLPIRKTSADVPCRAVTT